MHRLAREGLANVARHAPATGSSCGVDVAGEVVRLRRGRPGPPGVAARPAWRCTSGWSAWPSGPGRSAGDFEAGPTADGWRVEARLPIADGPAGRVRGAVIRVVIVDDQPVVRAGVARILGPDDGFEVVAECGDGDEVAAAVDEHQPDVVLMDIRMRRVDGVTATRRLARERTTRPPVLVLTTFDDDEALWGALDAGAAGFVLKDASAEDLIAATRAVANGAAWLDPKVAPRVLHAFRAERPAATGRGGADRRADRPRARRAAAHGERRDERRDRRRAVRQRGDREDATSARSSPSSACATGPRRSCSPTTTASSTPRRRPGARRSTRGRRRRRARRSDVPSAVRARTIERMTITIDSGPSRRRRRADRRAVVEVDGLVKRYGATEVVRDVSFAVRRGELFGLLGTNGAGKTTTVEILQGLRRADGGSVRGARPRSRRRPATGCAAGSAPSCRTPPCPTACGSARRCGCSPRCTRPPARLAELVDEWQLGAPAARGRSARSPAASASGCSSPSPWSAGPRSCSSTS